MGDTLLMFQFLHLYGEMERGLHGPNGQTRTLEIKTRVTLQSTEIIIRVSPFRPRCPRSIYSLIISYLGILTSFPPPPAEHSVQL